MRVKSLPSVVDFLRGFGFEFSKQPGGMLQINYPESVSAKDMAKELARLGDSVIKLLDSKEHFWRMQFVGGPLDGEIHGLPWGYCVVRQFEQGRWMAYRVLKDGRAVFAGIASSKAKANELAMSIEE